MGLHRTDLAMEANASHGQGELPGVQVQQEDFGAVGRTTVRILDQRGAQALGRPCGQYVTLTCDQFAKPDTSLRQALSARLAQALVGMLPGAGDVLVVGLGNRRVTPDALGPRVVDDILVTRHLRDAVPPALQGRLRAVSAIAPGVLGITGMETAEMIRSVVGHVRPVAVVAVDSLAARESDRICCTIQITDTGISPGSGVGNHRLGLNRDTLGVPVVAVGVPMVVYAATIAHDALELLIQDLRLEDGDHQQALDALVSRVVSQRLGDLVVTPRDVDALLEHMAAILATGINAALQPHLDQWEIPQLMQ
ncbi:MAG: GPR endopeptidase [Oscillospiraceae bacterium]|jgi:spore protease|nr:GPR endopeptidase [Oscillospiraceae bacterium]